MLAIKARSRASGQSICARKRARSRLISGCIRDEGEVSALVGARGIVELRQEESRFSLIPMLLKD
jgi:hypothetical protein